MSTEQVNRARRVENDLADQRRQHHRLEQALGTAEPTSAVVKRHAEGFLVSWLAIHAVRSIFGWNRHH